MKDRAIPRLAACLMTALTMLSCLPAASAGPLYFACAADNDLFRVASENGLDPKRFDSPQAAVEAAGEGDGVLLLANGYPAKTTPLDAALFNQAARKKLRLYVEYPSFLPGTAVGAPRGTQWERAVISSEVFAPGLRPLRILAIHDCSFVSMKSDHPLIVMARVAGFDTAVYGLPSEIFPILFELPKTTATGDLLAASTKLSQFITARYAPTDAWTSIWKYVFAWLQPGKVIPELKWTASVRPSFSADERLPEGVERQALKRGIDWYFNSRMVMHPSMMAKYNQPPNEPVPAKANPDPTQDWPYGHRVGLKPAANTPAGDGTLGILEGFNAKIFSDGSQPVMWWRRSDCNGEVAGAMSAAGLALNHPTYREVGGNIADWLYRRSVMSLGDRADPAHPAYGLVGWNDVPRYAGPSYTDGYGVYYSDDNARSGMGIILAAAALKTDRYDERVTRNLLALLRLAGKQGALPDRIDQPALERAGWQSYFHDPRGSHELEMLPEVWAYYLWAYQHTEFDLFLKQAKLAITEAMKRFPEGTMWRGISTRASMVLPLAWLVRVEDTPEHRQWLRILAESMNQRPNGAVPEEIRKGTWAAPPKSNEEYGSTESVLLQTNADAVSDLLYTVNFAFVGLHESAAATGDPFYREAEEKLAKFLCRIQIRSEKHPELDGGWFRAFDFKRWECWASSTDAGWGAWSIETGWSQSWITAVLALRQMNTSLWDITKKSNIRSHFDKLREEMLPDQVIKSREPKSASQTRSP